MVYSSPWRDPRQSSSEPPAAKVIPATPVPYATVREFSYEPMDQMTLYRVKTVIRDIIYKMMAAPDAVTLKMTADMRDLVILRDAIQSTLDAQPV